MRFGCLLVVVWWFVFGLFWLCFLDFGGWVGLTLLVMLCFVCGVLRFGWFWFCGGVLILCLDCLARLLAMVCEFGVF